MKYPLAPKREHGALRLIASFSVLPFLGMLAPFFLLPIIARTTGVEGWAAITVGQSAGAVAALAVSYGWSIKGPIELAQAEGPAQVARLHFEALRTGVFLLVAIGGLASVAAAAVAAPDSRGLSAATTAAASLNGLSATWIAIGLGQANLAIWLDTVPRLVATALCAAALVIFSNAYLYPIALGLSSLTSVTLFSVFLTRPWTGYRAQPGLSFRQRVWANSSAAGTVAAAGAYSNGALFVVGISTTTDATAGAASADKVYRAGVMAISTITNALQAWVMRGPRRTSRLRVSFACHLSVGAAGAVGLAVLGPRVTELLFGRSLAASTVTCVSYGLAFCLLAANSFVARHVMAPNNEFSEILTSTLIGATAGLPMIALLSRSFGAPGAAAGIACGEFAVLLTLTYLHWRSSTRSQPLGTRQ